MYKQHLGSVQKQIEEDANKKIEAVKKLQELSQKEMQK